MKITKQLYICLFMLVSVGNLMAQIPLGVTTNVIPPYPSQFNVWAGNASNYFVTIQNNSDLSFEVYVRISLEGTDIEGNETHVRILDDFRPTSGFTIPAYGLLQLDASDFEFSYGNLNETNLDLSPNVPLDLDGELPSGDYVLCAEVIEFNNDFSGELNYLSPVICSESFTVSYNNLELIFPGDESVQLADLPVNFTWNVNSSLGTPGDQDYILRLYELDSLQAKEESIYELVVSGDLPPVFTSDELNDFSYIYDENFGLYPLIPGFLYAAQVEIVSPGDLFFDNLNKSNINTFWFGFDPNESNGLDPSDGDDIAEDPGTDCFENCYFTDLVDQSAVAGGDFDEIQIGHFQMIGITDLVSSGNNYSGNGIISIPFLNDVQINVEFNNIEINSSGRVISGIVNAVEDQIYADEMSPSLAEDFNSFLRNGRTLSALAGSDTSTGMPLGMVQNVAGHNILIGFTEMSFAADRANCKLVSNVHIPSFGPDGWFSVAGSDICLHPSGFANEFILHMEEDLKVPQAGDVDIYLKGSEASSDLVTDEAAYIQMDCNGLKSFSIKADIHFPENMLIKENVKEGTLITDEGKVIATAGFTVDRALDADENIYAIYGEAGLPEEAGLHFLASLEIDPFQIKGVEGWGFEVQEMWMDASDLANPVDIVFPTSFEGETDDLWTGFYIKDMTLRTPKEFLGGNRREAVAIQNAIIDPSITLSIAVESLVSKEEGNVDGWAFSVDRVFMDIVQGRFESGGMEGEIGLPVSKEGTFLSYDAIIADSDLSNSTSDPVEYSFSINPSDELDVPILAGKAYLSENTHVMAKFKPGDAEETFFELFLEGGLKVDTEGMELENTAGENILPLELSLVNFDLTFTTDDGFKEYHFGFLEDFSIGDDKDGKTDLNIENMDYGGEFNEEAFAGFPIAVESVALENINIAQGEFNFKIEPKVILTPGGTGIAASTVLNFPAKLMGQTDKRIKLTGFNVSGAQIDTYFAGFTLEGGLEFYDTKGTNDVGEKGARGNLHVMLPMGIGMEMAAEFGSSTTNPNAEWNTVANYPYWYVDGMMYTGNAGFPIGPGLGIYGIGGGVSYNMTRSSYAGSQAEINAQLEDVKTAPQVDPDNMTSDDVRRTGVMPVPKFNTYGVELAGTIGTFPIAALVNADVSLQGEYTPTRGLTKLTIEGDAFPLCPLSLRNSTMLWASMNITYETPNVGQHIFHGGLTTYVNVLGLLKGAGNGNLAGVADVHFQNFGGTNNKGEWYIHLGEPDNRIGLTLGIGNKLGLSAAGYFMMGHGLPNKLPIPEKVEDLFGNSNSGERGSLTSGTISGSKNRTQASKDNAKDGVGFALGAEVDVTVGVRSFGVYATLSVFLGFDMNVTQSKSRTCYISGEGNMSPGVNDWYGSGQIYAGLIGDLGFYVKAFGKNHDLSLFKLQAAMMLSGGGPNPIWAEGRVGLSIEVLGGLIKCKKTVTVRAGESCIPEFSDPFGGVPMIVEAFPEDGLEEASVFTTPVISFTFPQGHEIPIPTLTSNGSTTTKIIKPRIESIVFKVKNTNSNIDFDEEWKDDDRKLVLRSAENLEELTTYRIKITMAADQQIMGGGFIPCVDEFGDTWYQDTVIIFTTGEFGAFDDAMYTSCPIRNQRYFLQDDVLNGNKGNATIDRNLDVDDFFPGEDNIKTYEYTIRMSPMDGSAPLEVGWNPPSSGTVSKISYVLPELENQKIYACQMIRKHTWKDPHMSFLDSPNGIQILNNGSLVMNANLDEETAEAYDIDSETEVSFENQAINPADDLAPNEFAMMTYFFRTSKFNSLEEKLDGLDLEYAIYDSELEIDMDEKFDVFDVRGEKYKDDLDDSEQRMDALIQMYDPFDVSGMALLGLGTGVSYTDYYSLVDQTLVELAESYAIKSDNNSALSWDWPDLNIDYLEDIDYKLNRKVINYSDPLSESEIDNSWATTALGALSPLASFNFEIDLLDGVFSSANNSIVDIDFYGKIVEDAEDIEDWALLLKDQPFGLHSTVGDWIDDNYSKFNNLLEDIQDSNYSKWSSNGRYKIKFYMDKSWRNDLRGTMVKEAYYTK